jgi:hypothetical protein
MNRPSVPSAAPLASAVNTLREAEIDPALEATLSAVESRLAGLADALRQRDLGAIDDQSAELHRALAQAVDHFSRASRSGTIPLALRHRLAQTGGRVAAQRESFARATAALDRAIDVLLPREAPAVYGIGGTKPRGSLGGSICA